jgi:NADPH:quinone reductase-like Zn-dependent oxidoreductase
MIDKSRKTLPRVENNREKTIKKSLRGESIMRAVRIHEHGTAEVLRYETDLPDLQPGSREVLVRVHACALNRLDIWVRNGIPAYQTPLPHILGSDIAGEVAETGTSVRGWHVGDQVILNPVVWCGTCRWCKTGRNNLCEMVQVLGAHRAGGYADYIVVPERNLHAKPTHLSFEEAAAVPLVFLTAWHMLVYRAHMLPGEWVLVIGANSGVGSAAIQIAKMLGALVIATAGNEEKMERARQIGADEVVNHYDPEWHKHITEKSEGSRMDIIIEHVGESVFEPCIKLLSKGGRLITCGTTTGANARLDLRYVFSRELEIHGSYIGTNAEMKRVLEFISAKKLMPVVDSVFPLEEARAAHEKLESRDFFGKIVLKMD